jgi:hypothetical protein
MTVVILLLALIGFGLGTSFRWPAMAASSAAIAVLLSAILQSQGFGALPGIGRYCGKGETRPDPFSQVVAAKVPADCKTGLPELLLSPRSNPLAALARSRAHESAHEIVESDPMFRIPRGR